MRAEILGTLTPEPLVVADRHRAGPTLDAEVKMLLLLPPGTETTGASLAYERDLAGGRLFRAVRPGIVQASADGPPGQLSFASRRKPMWDSPDSPSGG